MTDPIHAAAKAAASMFVDALGFGLGEHFTCSEAESVAELIRATHGEADADAFLQDHGAGDGEGDDHYQS